MKTSLLLLVLAIGGLALADPAPKPTSPVTTALLARADRAGRNLVAAAEQMPAEHYRFKPTAAQMSFGEVVVHVADGTDVLCSSIGRIAAPRRAQLGGVPSKEKAVERVREAFQFCRSALGRVDDTMLSEKVPYFGDQEISRADAMFAAAEEWAGHYSQLAVYFRLKGLLPPTARAGL